jgi:hypothetical protein
MHVPSLLDKSQFRKPADGYGVGIMTTTEQQLLSSTSNISQFFFSRLKKHKENVHAVEKA